MAENLDLQINNLKFRAATSDKYPYARATAPFRKEQFDSAPTVGDQSLSGWWTRGQLSFHKGAGVKYYEVLDGEEVIDRFWDSANIQFREPGEVYLAEDTYSPITGAATIKRVPIQTNSHFYWIDAGTNTLRSIPDAGDGTAAVPATTAVAVGTPRILARKAGQVFYVAGATSIERFTDATAGATSSGIYYTHTQTIVGMWWGKNRLWVLDVLGDLYAVSGTPAAPPETLGAKVGSLGEAEPFSTSVDYTSFAESLSGVYISNASQRVWYVGVGEDSSGGTLAWPKVVAEIPLDGWVSGLAYHLGHVVIVDTSGPVRVAQVAPDGSLTYGPASVTLPNGPFGSFTCRQLAVMDTSVYFTGPGVDRDAPGWSTTQHIYEINLAQSVDGGLQFATASVCSYTSANPTYWSGVMYASSTGWGFRAWHYGGIARSMGIVGGNPVPIAEEGFVRTGQHRFGTLDKKHFQSVTVRYEGTGTMLVYRVATDGTETLCDTIAVSGPGQSVVDLGMTAPVESIALKFVLQRGSTYTTPTLRGYQIKALPSPVRQRLIRWPLLIQDTYRDRYGVTHGKRDGAWPAWAELEALEEADALVSFTDHRTGETGNAYIESLELQMDTPSKGASTGFGGVGYLTLRRVS